MTRHISMVSMETRQACKHVPHTEAIRPKKREGGGVGHMARHASMVSMETRQACKHVYSKH